MTTNGLASATGRGIRMRSFSRASVRALPSTLMARSWKSRFDRQHFIDAEYLLFGFRDFLSCCVSVTMVSARDGSRTLAA